MIQDTWKAVVSAGRIGGAPNRASLYPHRLSSNLPRNPRSCSPAPKRTRAATATLWRSPNSESLGCGKAIIAEATGMAAICCEASLLVEQTGANVSRPCSQSPM